MARIASLLLAVLFSLSANVWADVPRSSGPANEPPQLGPRPKLSVPSLTQIRDILSKIESPIVSTLIQRFSLQPPFSVDIYGSNATETLFSSLHAREVAGTELHRYDYGRLEYPFTLPQLLPDHITKANSFPPRQFHQDTFSGNDNITAFYVSTVLPAVTSSTDTGTDSSYFFHLSNATAQSDTDADAVLTLDATLLQLMSHRAHIGKVVAESKYAGDVGTYTELIQKQDAQSIRMLLTNVTQEASVLAQADSAAVALSQAWQVGEGGTTADITSDVRDLVARTFRELIYITTEIEVQYLLGRLD